MKIKRKNEFNSEKYCNKYLIWALLSLRGKY